MDVRTAISSSPERTDSPRLAPVLFNERFTGIQISDPEGSHLPGLADSRVCACPRLASTVPPALRSRRTTSPSPRRRLRFPRRRGSRSCGFFNWQVAITPSPSSTFARSALHLNQPAAHRLAGLMLGDEMVHRGGFQRLHAQSHPPPLAVESPLPRPSPSVLWPASRGDARAAFRS